MNTCPFCNRQQPKKLAEVRYCESVTGHSVVCQGCGAMGPDCKTKREARYRWDIQPKRVSTLPEVDQLIAAERRRAVKLLRKEWSTLTDKDAAWASKLAKLLRNG